MKATYLPAYLPFWNSISHDTQWLTTVQCELFIDASDLGYRCYFQDHWCHGACPKVDFKDKLMNINWMELYRVTMALSIWGSHFHSKRIHIHCGNSSVVQIMNKCSTRSKSTMVLVHSLVMLGIKPNSYICLQHIPGVDNSVDDSLWRFRNESWELIPDADIKIISPSTFKHL